MKPGTLLATAAGKSVYILLKILQKSRGETAPGLVALTLDPTYVSARQQKIPHRIIISGTNGKTTTTSLLSNIIAKQGYTYLTNPSGSNLLRGIASALLKLKKNTDFVLWEADEAALIHIARDTKPTHLVLTNLFRDQMDRYGEIDTTFKKWIKLLAELPTLTLILNADDPNLAYLGSQATKHTVIYFGIDSNTKATQNPESSADAIFCPICNKELEYKAITYSHLGTYSCSCGFKKPKMDFIANNIEFDLTKTTVSINEHQVIIPLIGMYNIYNTLAAFTVASEVGIKPSVSVDVLKNYSPVFGRQEVLFIKNKKVQLFLVKNPTGFNQVIDSLNRMHKKVTLCIAINDRIADGKDVSWLWDVDFERFITIAKHIIVTGDRALDMGVRLKYSGIDQKGFTIVQDKKEALSTLLARSDSNVFLLPTYTALWEFREILKEV